MDVSNWSNESILEDEDKGIDDHGDNGKKPKIGFFGGCLIAIGGIFLLLLTMCGAISLMSSSEKYPEVSISNNPGYLVVGQTHKLEAMFTDLKESKVTWESDTPEVMSVTQSGEIKGLKTGHAMITATTANGDYFGQTTIVVLIPAKKVVIRQQTIQLKVGTSIDPGIQVIPSNASIALWSDNIGVATVGGTKIFGVKPGTTVIHIVKGLEASSYISGEEYGKIEVVVK